MEKRYDFSIESCVLINVVVVSYKSDYATLQNYRSYATAEELIRRYCTCKLSYSRLDHDFDRVGIHGDYSQVVSYLSERVCVNFDDKRTLLISRTFKTSESLSFPHLSDDTKLEEQYEHHL